MESLVSPDNTLRTLTESGLSPEIQSIVSRIPVWANARDLRIAPLQGVINLNNANYKVSAQGAEYILRIASSTAGLLGIRRENEREASLAAAEAGVAPEVLFFVVDGHLVTPWIDGRHWQPEEFLLEENIQRLAETLRRLQGIQNVEQHSSVFIRVQRFLQTAESLSVEVPEKLVAYQNAIHAFEERRRSDARFRPSLCHNDLWSNNFLDDGKQLWLIDWEFAATGDGLYDLATLSLAGKFSEEQNQRLLHLSGYTEPGDLEDLQTMQNAVRLFEATWAVVQHGLRGPEGHDYMAYARRTLEAMRDIA